MARCTVATRGMQPAADAAGAGAISNGALEPARSAALQNKRYIDRERMNMALVVLCSSGDTPREPRRERTAAEQ